MAKIIVIPLVACAACHQQLRSFVDSELAKLPDAVPLLHWIDKITVADNSDDCPFGDCETRKRAKAKSDSESGGSCIYGGVPNECNCVEQLNDMFNHAALHKEILGYIKQIEDSYHELLGVVDEVVHYARPINHDLPLDPSIPFEDVKDKLRRYNSRCLAFGMNNEKVEAPPGRPFCVVWCSNEMHCHVEKILKYAPADCNCRCAHPVCSCLQCTLFHVKHYAEDYEDAIGRVKRGTTKLQAMPTSKMAAASDLRASETNTGGCGMPGVRKAKNLTKFTNAQKDAYNRGK